MYGKVFKSIYKGTLYGQWEAIVTMQQLIVLATPDGVVDMTPPAIAGETSIPIEIIEKGIEILSNPDPYSRTPGDDGVRIKLLDDHKPWGWFIVNHEKYNAMQKVEDKRKADRERIKSKRKALKNKDVAECRKVSQKVAHTDTDLDLNTDLEKDINPTAWADYEQHRKEKKKPITPLSKTKQQNILRKHPFAEQQKMVDTAIANGWTGLYPLKDKKPHPNDKWGGNDPRCRPLE